MKEMDNNLDAEVRLWQEKLFSRSIRRDHKLKRISGLIGSATNLQCLDISTGDGIISSHLRSLGGSWKTMVTTKDAAVSINYSLGEAIAVIENGKLPFEDHSFDRLVIVDTLKEFTDDYEFLHECHRVLKNDGWVIISEERRAPLGPVALLQRTFGLLPSSNEKNCRNGYKVHELFETLKDGFDVPETIVYSNVLLEFFATFGEVVQRMVTGGPCWLVREKAGQKELYNYRQIYGLASFAFPLMWLLSLLEFLPGQKLLIKSRRRLWRPRLQPKLIDGRSIAEAAINTKIGTAAPF
ncbi:MAG: class I SAM-dependent methyltransferase [Kiritimatiellaceae bacterium]|nr:class I SAM-dependent methyltransferase [Kiritimatiellaceae bacterium]